jgi:hypothetical protein
MMSDPREAARKSREESDAFQRQQAEKFFAKPTYGKVEPRPPAPPPAFDASWLNKNTDSMKEYEIAVDLSVPCAGGVSNEAAELLDRILGIVEQAVTGDAALMAEMERLGIKLLGFAVDD